MNISQFKLSYYTFLVLLKLFVFLSLGIWAYNSFNYFEQTHFFSYISDLTKVEKNLTPIWEIIKTWLISSVWVMLKVIFIQCTAYAFRRCWIMTKWLTYWDSIGDINPIFGRNISEHFRWNNTMNFMQIIYIYNLSSVQYKFLNMHSKNNHIVNISQKYDPFYLRDMNYMKTQKQKKIIQPQIKSEVNVSSIDNQTTDNTLNKNIKNNEPTISPPILEDKLDNIKKTQN